MRIYITTLMLVATLGVVSCGGGNETASTGASVTAQATTATVLACNASTSFGGTGPLLTETSNPTLEACNAAIAFTCNASMSFGGTEPTLTDVTSPSIKTCLAVFDESNPNNPNNAKVLAGQATIWTPYSNGGCLQSVSMYGNGPKISEAQVIACGNAMSNANANAMSSANAQQQCKALGGWFLYNYYCTIPVAAP